ncbi:MAG: hypothetical protein ACJA0M_002643 [Chitinophagales bacterium]
MVEILFLWSLALINANPVYSRKTINYGNRKGIKPNSEKLLKLY